MSRLAWLGLVVVTAACAGGTEPSGTPFVVTYQVYIESSAGGPSPGPGLTVMVHQLRVRGANGGVVADAVVRLQADVGVIDASSVTTDLYGGAKVTWTLPLPTPVPYTLSACATKPADAPCTYKPIWGPVGS